MVEEYDSYEAAGELVAEMTGWLRRRLQAASAGHVVVGLSGGVDSAAVAALCTHALGSTAVLGVLLPAESDPDDAADADQLAHTLGLGTVRIDLGPVLAALLQAMPAPYQPQANAGAGADRGVGNLKSRLRMAALYYLANSSGALVVGTGNKSELMIGYFTKYGDGAADLLPLGGLYKHQVRALARHLGVPERIVTKTPSAGLWPGQTDEEELGFSYDELDRTLAALESGHGALTDSGQQRIAGLVAGNEHKRHPPAVFQPGTQPSQPQ